MDFIHDKEEAYAKLIPLALQDLNAPHSPVTLTEENLKWYIDRLYEHWF